MPPLAVSKFLNLFLNADQVESSTLLECSQAFSVRTFQLGEEIGRFTIDVDTANQPALFYLVCQGRVRLLCESFEQSRETTAMLLEADAAFGADFLFTNILLPYRAIAASSVQVASVPTARLTGWLKQFSRLEGLLGNSVQQRQRLIFFKRFTVLHSLPSSYIHQFVDQLVEQTIPAGSRLTQATPSEVGHFWLRQGTVSGSGELHLNGQAPSQMQPPTIGEDWGYPNLPPSDWKAQTDLVVYQLAPERWAEIAALGDGVRSPSRSLRLPVSLPPQVSPPQAKPDSPTRPNQLAHQSASIAFPKPLKRRLLSLLDRYPWIEQQSSSDCGAACLGMIGRYWGKNFPIYLLREQANVGRSGASLKNLASAAENLGFQARPVRASLSRLAEQKNPWIAHWEGMHYVVVYTTTAKRVFLADPAIGRRSLSRTEFQAHWTGYALLLDPTEQLRQTEVKQASLNRYLTALFPYRGLILQVILVSLLIQILGLVTPLFTQIILDQVVVQKSQSALNIFALGLLLFSVWGICMAAVRQYLLSYFSNRLDLTLISGFIRHTLTLPLKFFESRRVGDILTRVQENQKIQRFLIGQVVLAWLDFLTGFVYLGLMLYYNWRLTLLVLALIPPIVLLTLGATPWLRQVSRQIFNEAADQSSTLVEMISGVATIKAAAAEQELRWGWEDHLTRQMNMQFKGQKLGIGLQTASGLINTLGSTALLWYGAMLVIQDDLSVGQFVAFNMMTGYVISPVIALVNLWDELQEVFISIERLNDVFEAQPESAQSTLLLLPTLRGEIRFEDVSFRYGEDEDYNVLQNISFDVEAGQTVAIVGRSGSGKSTLVKLLQGLYPASRGHVLIDGHDIRHTAAQSLRSQLGVVPQECFLFSGSILENITLYRSEFTLEQAVEAAKLAEAHAFIQSLPLGYSTKVGERGSSLSGGQRQRIAIARALLGEPQILILDEATSSLDTESERRFQRNLAQLRRGSTGAARTTLIIAHRLSTVRSADKILVLDRGILVEQGDHDALMKLHGLYYHLVQQQLDL
ncbi:MAG: ATP-binding cassette domain-containing protein [Pegethrix bostrychoides GSE-TBD4-15B]|uniref:ATP-binding cassette domain-containing protein n=1 Tax=Pegethrix bostrychoides GSE-TBD4-15B TaxID=2839662 RepID=A0A951U546_9CYAN|nr:ATP-binding cassette domain-containing protein [Pegethrix bostrychoides GSE-TBD4-15B]